MNSAERQVNEFSISKERSGIARPYHPHQRHKQHRQAKSSPPLRLMTEANTWGARRRGRRDHQLLGDKIRRRGPAHGGRSGATQRVSGKRFNLWPSRIRVKGGVLKLPGRPGGASAEIGRERKNQRYTMPGKKKITLKLREWLLDDERARPDEVTTIFTAFMCWVSWINSFPSLILAKMIC